MGRLGEGFSESEGSRGRLAKGLQALWLCHVRSGTASNAKLFFKSGWELNLPLA